MLHLDYNWDLYPSKIILDEELNTTSLGWRAGDYFKLVEINGKMQFIKLDPLEAFLIDGVRQQNGCS